jgi:hypothetical protein
MAFNTLHIACIAFTTSAQLVASSLVLRAYGGNTITTRQMFTFWDADTLIWIRRFAAHASSTKKVVSSWITYTKTRTSDTGEPFSLPSGGHFGWVSTGIIAPQFYGWTLTGTT